MAVEGFLQIKPRERWMRRVPYAHPPRVISEKARVRFTHGSPAEAQRATALGGRISRGRDVTFIRKVIAYHFVDPATAAPCGFAPYSLRKTSTPRT